MCSPSWTLRSLGWHTGSSLWHVGFYFCIYFLVAAWGLLVVTGGDWVPGTLALAPWSLSHSLYHEGSPQKKCTLNLGWAGAKLITNNTKIFSNPHGRHTDHLEQLVSVTQDEGLGISCRGLCWPSFVESRAETRTRAVAKSSRDFGEAALY